MKAKRNRAEFRKAVDKADVVVEVLDARDPPSFRMPQVEEKIKQMGKGLVLAINKIDLVPQRVYVGRTKYFEQQGYHATYVSATKRMGTRILRTVIKKAAPDPNKDTIYVAIVGYPNVGKSTIINVLRGRHGAPTGSLPGVTRYAQEFRLGQKIRVLDTPGVYPIEDIDEMVYKGAISPEELSDPVPHAIKLIERLRELDPNVIKKHYKVDHPDPEKALELIAKRRGLLLKGGEPNVEEAARLVIRDRHRGKIVVRREPPV